MLAVSFPITHDASLKPPNESQSVALMSLEEADEARKVGIKNEHDKSGFGSGGSGLT